MKKTILASIMSLLLGNAVAGGNNSVYIDQSNADNSTTTITQTGSGNQVGDRTDLLSPSFVIDGNNMILTIEQDGMNNTVVGNFIGGDSTMSIYQTGSGNTSTINMGNFGTNGGTMTITVNGDNNNTLYQMAANANTGNYSYTATITGSNNTLSSTMDSKYIVNTIAITGDYNTFTTVQNGANGTATNPGHKIESTVVGNYNAVSITQNGTTTPNYVTLNIAGNSTSTTIIQH